ncbi:MAG: preprotein translocase subunit SecG [Planctomycetes bacterium B3_Pla]|nr:MAG: preprotein translocase subunit SecG [Planctomycetes bacterium B3_Pla]
MAVFPSLAAVSFIMNIVAVLFIICCVVLILVILIQKGRGGGLSAAFGGGGAGGILGSKTGDFLTWVTITLVGVFLSLAVVMAKYYKPMPPSADQQALSQEQTIATAGEAPGDANDSAETNSPGN